MAEPQKPSEMAEQVVGNIQKDFKIVGTGRVHSWYAWAIVGIVFGMALGVIYVANRSGQFSTSEAKKPKRVSTCIYISDGSTKPVTANGRKTKEIDSFYVHAYRVAFGNEEKGEGELEVADFILTDAAALSEAALNDCKTKRTAAVSSAQTKCLAIETKCKKGGTACKYVDLPSVKQCSEPRCSVEGTTATCTSDINDSEHVCSCNQGTAEVPTGGGRGDDGDGGLPGPRRP